MKFVSFNIQYSKGKDGKYDLERIANAVRGADIIGLQEVARNFPEAPDTDQPARLAELFPDYYCSYASPIDVDLGSTIIDGKTTSHRFEFGNMLLSRWPITSKRSLLLPRVGSVENFDLQNGALEAIINNPDGSFRVYVTHLNALRGATRLKQLDWLVPKLFAVTSEGACLTGDQWKGINIPEAPKSFVVLGDFNLAPDSEEYDRIVGKSDYYHGRVVTNEHWVDTWTRTGHNEDNSETWFDEDDDFKTGRRLDYGFVSPDLATKVISAHIDQENPASDHQPYWFELDF